ncbi:hypothetical protein NPIL_280771 [Nephila pilipes]|uniref:Uncharacterized protein n=1 Tax=Nephila pilipes TaxID=299642 RepID=A0A8X6JNF7_NEPPI|nr:hypothetical protein NPIL_280771 [Nephila pilipes]
MCHTVFDKGATVFDKNKISLFSNKAGYRLPLRKITKNNPFWLNYKGYGTAKAIIPQPSLQINNTNVERGCSYPRWQSVVVAMQPDPRCQNCLLRVVIALMRATSSIASRHDNSIKILDIRGVSGDMRTPPRQREFKLLVFKTDRSS